MTLDVDARLATWDLDSWELDDGEVVHREAPSTFWIPLAEDRQTLRKGDLVKLIFRIKLIDESGDETVEVERMWVIVDGTRGGLYEGTLDNDPYCTTEIKSGTKVFFEPRHVIAIDRTKAADA